MQSYIIKSFRRSRTTTVIFTLDPRTGNYVYNGESKGLMDFMCDGSYKIHSVQRNQTNGGELPQETFTVGSRLSGSNGIIQEITIVNGKVVLTGAVGPVPIATATYNVEPVATQPTGTTGNAGGTGITGNTELDTLQAQIIASYPRQIRLSNLLRRRTETFPEFMTRFFRELNGEKNTIYVDDKSIQTEAGKRRSLGDIFMICRYYYPTITLKELLQQLYVTLPAVLNPGFRTSKCGMIHKRVWYYNPHSSNNVADESSTDEYGKRMSWYQQKIR